MSSVRWSRQAEDRQINVIPEADLYFHCIMRALQTILAIPVMGIYASALPKPDDEKPSGYDPSKWEFPVVLAVLSIITAIVSVEPRLRRWILWPVDFILFILWLVVLGIFEQIFITGNSGNDSDKVNRHAVLLDLVNMVLWMVTFLVGIILRHGLYIELWQEIKSR